MSMSFLRLFWIFPPPPPPLVHLPMEMATDSISIKFIRFLHQPQKGKLWRVERWRKCDDSISSENAFDTQITRRENYNHLDLYKRLNKITTNYCYFFSLQPPGDYADKSYHYARILAVNEQPTPARSVAIECWRAPGSFGSIIFWPSGRLRRETIVAPLTWREQNMAAQLEYFSLFFFVSFSFG